VIQPASFAVAFVGHYTKDTIVYPHSTRTVEGGAYFFGANVAARMGLRVAVVTRLAREDWGAVEKLERLEKEGPFNRELAEVEALYEKLSAR
jgi:sugar/nucleoside kinase (ribokinase family)